MVNVAKSQQVRQIRGRKRRAAPIFGLWLFLLFCCLLAAYFFIHSAFFAVAKLEVKGNAALPADGIIQQSGLTLGVNIFKVNTREAVQKLSVNPAIKKVNISRRMPATLIIQVTERIPVALVVGQNGFVAVDGEGVYIKKLTDLQGLRLPVISGIPINENERPGNSIKTPGLGSALQLIKLMDKTFLDNVAEIMAPTPQSLSLKTLQGVEVRFGEPVELERKMKLIQQLLVKNDSIINNQTVEYIDLRYDTAPVIKRKS